MDLADIVAKVAPEIGMAALFIFYLLKKDKAHMEAAVQGHKAAMELAKAISELKGVIQQQQKQQRAAG